MLKVDKLSFSYKKKKVLEDITFSLERGKLYGLFGPNGAGKTTLLRCCLGSLKPDYGSISYNGLAVNNLKASKLARIFSWVPQEHSTSFSFTVLELVLMGLAVDFGSSPKEEHKNRASNALQKLGIEDLADRPYNKLSGGQRQLTLIARALAQNSPILFFDEPGTALDYKNQAKLWQILKAACKEGKTVLACVHDPNQLLWYCDKAIVLSEGRIKAFGALPDTLNTTLLKELYGNSITIGEISGLPLIYPAEL